MINPSLASDRSRNRQLRDRPLEKMAPNKVYNARPAASCDILLQDLILPSESALCHPNLGDREPNSGPFWLPTRGNGFSFLSAKSQEYRKFPHIPRGPGQGSGAL